jgi:tRNA(Arg) A34 adenosine deaminase TadA
MCLSASAHSRIARVVFACRDPSAGGARTPPPGDWYRTNWPRLEHQPKFEAESAALLLRYIEGRAGWDSFRASLEAVLRIPR